METTFDKELKLLRLHELKKQVDESSEILKSMAKDLDDLNKQFNYAANETEKILDNYNKNQYIKSKPYKILTIKVNISLILVVLLVILSLVAAFIKIDWHILIPLGLGVLISLYSMHLINIILSGIRGDLDYIRGDMEDSISIMGEVSEEYEICYANYKAQYKLYQGLLKEYQDLYKEIEGK